MGLLDDAIREHLELKRKHGAAEEELLRQETEALGPARRDFNAEGAAAAAAAEPVPAEPAAAVPEPASEPVGWLDDEPGEAPFEAAAEPRPEPVAREPLPAPDPAPADDESTVVERQQSDTPTEGFPALTRDDEPARTAAEAPPEAEEDVLEETPDFLQDTPEHDRLWFEQKPPRDFDFDG